MRRHTLLVTRTGARTVANEYTLYKIRGFTPTDSAITSYTQTMASAILF